MARTEIGTIIDALVALEATITGATVAFDETPENIAGLCWLNFPLRGIFRAMTGWAEDTHVIACACVKRAALQAQDEAIMRPLITQFPDKVHAALTLSGSVAHADDIEYQYGYIDLLSSDEVPIFGILFEVPVTVKDNITVAA